MSIYTKNGDRGITTLYDGNRVSKSDIRIKVCGETDELNSFIGLVFSKIKDKSQKKLLLTIQKDLHDIMGFLSGSKLNILQLQKEVGNFELIIDGEQKKLEHLDRFIIPSGSEISSWFHILRTICRRAERAIVEGKITKQFDNEAVDSVISYLNRLSDLFFVFARVYNKKKEIQV